MHARTTLWNQVWFGFWFFPHFHLKMGSGTNLVTSLVQQIPLCTEPPCRPNLNWLPSVTVASNNTLTP